MWWGIPITEGEDGVGGVGGGGRGKKWDKKACGRSGGASDVPDADGAG